MGQFRHAPNAMEVWIGAEGEHQDIIPGYLRAGTGGMATWV